jgi:hypothetical protein
LYVGYRDNSFVPEVQRMGTLQKVSLGWGVPDNWGVPGKLPPEQLEALKRLPGLVQLRADGVQIVPASEP